MTKSSGSATVLASVSMAGLLPKVFLVPLAGAVVDRWYRRLTMVLANGLSPWFLWRPPCFLVGNRPGLAYLSGNVHPLSSGRFPLASHASFPLADGA